MPTIVMERVTDEGLVVGPAPVAPATGAQCFVHEELGPEALLRLVKAHSQDFRAVDVLTALPDRPVVAVTDDDDDVERSGVRVYPVLGWTNTSILRGTLSQRLDALNPVAAFRLLDQPEIARLERSNLDYVVLLDAEGLRTGQPVAGAISARDIDLWCTSDPSELEGAFAVDVLTYCRSFAGTGVAA